MYAQVKKNNNDNNKSVQRKKTSESINLTGLPNKTKAMYENMSGFSFDDVRVHYNSSKPAQLKALAYTQGNQIFVAPGQETHLNHELGHVVQQKQGKVVPTSYYNGIPINDNAALESEADNICFTPPRQISSSAFSSSAPTVQMLRKRVKGLGEVDKEDIFYDKSDGQYYNNVNVLNKESVQMIDTSEYKKYQNAIGKERSAHTIIAAKTKSDSYIIKFKEEKDSNIKPIECDSSYKGTELSAGTEMKEPPISVRLYAEGNFDHAAALASKMTEKTQFDKLMGIGSLLTNVGTSQTTLPSQTMVPSQTTGTSQTTVSSQTPVLIKGTEFDSKENVRRRYNKKSDDLNSHLSHAKKLAKKFYKNDRIKRKTFIIGYQDFCYNNQANLTTDIKENEYLKKIYNWGRTEAELYCWVWYWNRWGKKIWEFKMPEADFGEIDEKLDVKTKISNLETSFGTSKSGGTGDLSRTKVDNPFKRKYDLIQSTFFWLPRHPSKDTMDVLMLFLKNQYNKLKDNGVIRITLTNRGDSNFNDQNQFKTTANAIVDITNKAELKNYYTCELIEIKDSQSKPVSYSKALEKIGLNEGEKFKHTRTDNTDTVETTTGDLIIEAKKIKKEDTLQKNENSID